MPCPDLRQYEVHSNTKDAPPMIWIYLLAAALIAWGLCKDITRRETWMIGFGKVVRRDQPVTYWSTILLRFLIFAAVLVAAWLRSAV